MNRRQPRHRSGGSDVPRERGDEPVITLCLTCGISMFPASAGMNRGEEVTIAFPDDVPRERGDEPTRGLANTQRS